MCSNGMPLAGRPRGHGYKPDNTRKLRTAGCLDGHSSRFQYFVAHTPIRSADPQNSRQIVLSRIFKSHVPLHCLDRSTHDYDRITTIFQHTTTLGLQPQKF